MGLAACGGDSTGPQVVTLAGTWNYTDNISSSSAGISCNSSGTVSISQTQANFSGTATASSGTCTDSFGNTADNTGAASISGGQIVGNQVTFQTTGCQYTATVSGSPANAMSGTETCTAAISGTNYVFTGPFQASR
jgi:hypothetical protein